MTESYKL